MHRRNTRLTPLGLLAAAALSLGCPLASAVPSAGIYIAGEATGNVTVYNHAGALLDGGASGFSISDGFAVGDVDGDGADEMVIGGDVTGEIQIFRLGMDASPTWTFPGNFTISDGLAVGDVMGDDKEEILVAGDASGDVEIYDLAGTLLATRAIAYTILDGFTVGDLDGDGKDEILVAGDVSGTVDVFNGAGGLVRSFAGAFSVADGFAAGDIDGDGNDEILIAGDVSGDVDVFDGDGTLIRTFFGDYTISDGFAVGDVDGDGLDDIAIAGDVSGDVAIWSGNGGLRFTRAMDFTVADGFAIGRHAFPDRDYDGLLDSWETVGFDADGDTTIDINLPAPPFLADPDHKDIFLEFDWTAGDAPNQLAIRGLKNAFALAPIWAGGTNNPDGQPGINLHVDTGSLTDPQGFEGPSPPPDSCTDGIDNDNDGGIDQFDGTCWESGSCSDGIDNDNDGRTDANDAGCAEGRASCSDTFDNDGDGLLDAADPDCLVGDNLGGGGLVTTTVDCLDTLFYAAKTANFSSIRRRLFRYGISTTTTGCGGGKSEIGGNDFVELNHDAGTIMHEFGHALNLRHGGADDMNCKPNFVSVMNYDNQFGIPQTDGSRIFDYSPPRRADMSRGGALWFLQEDQLDETDIVDADDASNMMTFTDGTNFKRVTRVDQVVDWDGDFTAGGSSNVTVNVDDDGALASPASCDNSADADILYGHDDWSVVALNFRGFGDYANAAKNPVIGPEPTLTEMLVLERSVNTTDLAVTVTDSADPAVAGTTLDYVLTARNVGGNPTTTSQLRATLPAGVTHVATPGCFFGGDTITCDIGMLFPGEQRVFTATVLIDADLVHVAGAPVSISVATTIVNHAGDDPVPGNNGATEGTLVVAVADLDLLSLGMGSVPLELLIGEPATVTATETLTSHGPSSPMDVRITRTASAAAGATLSLDEPSALAPALANGEVRNVSSSLQLGCNLPGSHAFQVGSTIAPDRPDDADPNLANNAASENFAVECVVPVSIRIHPTMNSRRSGVVPVEIRSNEAGQYGLPLAFDARSINVASLRFGAKADVWAESGGAREQHRRGHGGDDQTMHFTMTETGLVGTEGVACVKGTFTDPDGDTFKFFGCDTTRWSRR